MEDLIQLILFIIFGAVALLGRLFSRRRPKQEPDVVLEEGEVVLPPWGNVPMEEETPEAESVEPERQRTRPASVPDMESKTDQPRTPAMRTRPEAESRKTPESRTDSPPPEEPAIAGIPLSPETFRQGIILSEILGRPKSLRRPRQ